MSSTLLLSSKVRGQGAPRWHTGVRGRARQAWGHTATALVFDGAGTRACTRAVGVLARAGLRVADAQTAKCMCCIAPRIAWGRLKARVASGLLCRTTDSSLR